MLINLEREDDVFILTMDSGENRWNTNFVRAFDARLDEVMGSEGPAAMITASSNPKFFSNGLDLDWRRGEGDGNGGDGGNDGNGSSRGSGSVELGQ